MEQTSKITTPCFDLLPDHLFTKGTDATAELVGYRSHAVPLPFCAFGGHMG